jgi:hypothetical protein
MIWLMRKSDPEESDDDLESDNSETEYAVNKSNKQNVHKKCAYLKPKT